MQLKEEIQLVQAAVTVNSRWQHAVYLDMWRGKTYRRYEV